MRTYLLPLKGANYLMGILGLQLVVKGNSGLTLWDYC
jgi:hypothetical protein